MIDRLESSSSNSQPTRKILTKKSFHDDHSDGGGSIQITSSPSFNRVIRRENHDHSLTNGNTGSFIFRHKSPHGDSVTRFELNRNEIVNGERRTASGTTVSYCLKQRKKRNQISYFFR
jgi:hypothetical protein